MARPDASVFLQRSGLLETGSRTWEDLGPAGAARKWRAADEDQCAAMRIAAVQHSFVRRRAYPVSGCAVSGLARSPGLPPAGRGHRASRRRA